MLPMVYSMDFGKLHHPWDLCAGKLIVEEAGGLVTNFDGKPINIYSKQILASNSFIHQKMIDVLNSV